MSLHLGLLRIYDDIQFSIHPENQDSCPSTITHTSVSDNHNNVHWLIARGGRAYTLDVIISGIDGPGYGIDNLDPERARPAGNGLLRMPTLGVEEALRRYGKDHHV